MRDPSVEICRGTKQSHEDRGFVRFDKSNIERSIPQIFERQVCASPQGAVVGCDQKSLSYDDLNRLSNRIAHAILRRRGDKEEPVALLLRQGPAAVAAILGSLKSGKIYVPLEPTQPVPALQGIIAHCQPGLIIAERETEALARRLIGEADRCLNVETMRTDGSQDNPDLVLSPDRVCYIFYTSGTTGPPKGVFDNHRNVLHNIMRYTNNLEIGAKDRLSLIESCSYSGTVSSLFSALLNGAAICPFDLQGQGIARLASWIGSERITIFHSTPTIFEQLMATDRKFDSLRMIRLEGDRAEPRQISLFQSRFGAECLLVNGLGLTEAGIVRQYFVTPQTRVDGDVVPIGQAIEDMTINLVDKEGGDVEQGSVGEIAIRSKYLACGYWKRPDLTEAAFLPDPSDGDLRIYRTGDLGRMRANGCLDYVGRQDFRAKIRGQWVDTAKIENALHAMEPISQALVVVRDDGFGAQQLVAYLVATGPRPSVEGMRQMLGESLPAVMVPSRYVFIASMPLDRNGKVARRSLPAPERHRPALEQAFVAPHTHEEEIVAECFCTVLKLDSVGVHDDFLDLGGDSLLATELSLMIEERMGVDCSLAFIGQTFSVASIVSRLGQDYPESPLVRIQTGDARPPLFCIHNYSGDLFDYYRLAAYLHPKRNVYGVQSRAFTKTASCDATIEEMATAYLTEITAVEPEGPYYLCGVCMGGTIAFEIAQLLRRQGREVALLALIDTAYPAGPLRDMVYRVLDPYHWRRFSRLPASHWPLHFARRFQSFARWAMTVIKRRLVSATDPVGGRWQRPESYRRRVLDRNKVAQARYKPRPYGGEIVLIIPSPLFDQRGWIRIAAGGCNLIELPLVGEPEKSPHLTQEPYVETLAAHISGFFEA
jgi:amino acid adenylation domain-containing protein